MINLRDAPIGIQSQRNQKMMREKNDQIPEKENCMENSMVISTTMPLGFFISVSMVKVKVSILGQI